MASKYLFNQVIYNADNSDYNVPSSLVTQKDVNTVLRTYTSIYHLGVRTIPGTKIYFNGDTEHPIIIGFSGVFEIDFTDLSQGFISNISVDADSLAKIAENKSAYLVFDILYLAGGAGET